MSCNQTGLLDLTPIPPAQIRAIAGATVSIGLRLSNPDQTPLDPTGVTVSAEFSATAGSAAPVAGWTVQISASATETLAILSLTQAQTAALGAGAPCAWRFPVWLTDAYRRLPLLRGTLELLGT